MGKQSLHMIDFELAILLRRVTSMTTNPKFGNLERSEYLLLNQITMHGAAGMKSLSEYLHLDISTVSRQTSALENKGYVYRIPDPSDGRAYSLMITESGVRELHAYKQARLIRMEELLEGWNEEEREAFGQLLQKFNHSFR